MAEYPLSIQALLEIEKHAPQYEYLDPDFEEELKPYLLRFKKNTRDPPKLILTEEEYAKELLLSFIAYLRKTGRPADPPFWSKEWLLSDPLKSCKVCKITAITETQLLIFPMMKTYPFRRSKLCIVCDTHKRKADAEDFARFMKGIEEYRSRESLVDV